MTFTATAEARPRGGISIGLPFQPADVWGDRDRYYVTGVIEGYPMRATIAAAEEPVLELGPSWCRDPRVGAGATLRVTLRPEGPQIDELERDFGEALRADAVARRNFESLATFYRKAFVTWVDGARKQEARAHRVRKTVAALRAGRRER
jgi:hypothetical protein